VLLGVGNLDDLVDQLLHSVLDAAFLVGDSHQLGALGDIEVGDCLVVDEDTDRALCSDRCRHRHRYAECGEGYHKTG